MELFALQGGYELAYDKYSTYFYNLVSCLQNLFQEDVVWKQGVTSAVIERNLDGDIALFLCWEWTGDFKGLWGVWEVMALFCTLIAVHGLVRLSKWSELPFKMGLSCM